MVCHSLNTFDNFTDSYIGFKFGTTNTDKY